ncbi:transcriptional regulator, AbrB family [Nitrosococcus oceani ATCC 19707]|uniref:Transcriptional regulator, AbrB family n=2 Tax=Nitrosococcus oceani TaxID=1229 RepID=Q3J848_NITOC|nr:AbrB/MazE/SpoVT family DNA-binding domain-containing protein [Nitrosococcus oceani]ABA58998.1 transcriptional regulator, AbrB family [Nitrosococcus oceani ATCC 19707]KFI18520.1 AbrB family transcriptional regulator [Nitrosococcus oceani C-27]GEM21240.1 AbrB family transcriptional regulator [Nitrosococcus oceani]
MEITRLSSKGQIIIPKTIRAAHHWDAGMEFIVEERDGNLILRPLKPFPVTRLEKGLGCTGYQGSPKSLEEMDKGIAESLRQCWSKNKKR